MSLEPNKVCPVVLRKSSQGLEILCFTHPAAGNQLVKGTLEPPESPEAGALRELAEESGIESAAVVRSLGYWASGYEGQVWAFFECQPQTEPPDAWVHMAPDDGGHAFEFFWHPVSRAPDETLWHPLFRGALAFLRNVV